MSFFDFKPPELDNERLNQLMADLVPAPSAEQTDKLIENTSKVHSGIETLSHYSQNLALLTETLVNETKNVHREVALLNSSSERLEHLTVRVKNLTWALFFLALLAAVIPIGIEVWKAYHQEPAPRPQVTAPQTPAPFVP
jgi:hypothetical protein